VRIHIDRTHCDLCQSYCDRHVARLIQKPQGEDRPCIQAVVDDGRPELTLVVQDGVNQATLTLSDEDRLIFGLEGLSPFWPWNAATSGQSLLP
jgi:hypothetical protein